MSRSVFLLFVMIVAIFTHMPFQLASSQAQDAPAATRASNSQGHHQALLIGMSSYQHASPLRYTANDVAQLASTLSERGDYQVMAIVDSVRDNTRQSEAEALQTKVAQYLAALGPQDKVLVYFSGHGFRADDDSLYLAMTDCNPEKPASGGVPVRWLREQLAICKAGSKLLILDACHAGSEKGVEEETQSVAANDLAGSFRGLDVVTVASSQSREKSLVWSEKRQSLFTYWLNQGLKGHADQNGNGQVTIDELYEYVFDNVTDVAEKYFNRRQTPVRIIQPGTLGVPVVISLKPHTLQGALADMAEQMSTVLQLRGMSKVGVPEFMADAQDRVALGGQFGTMGRYCAVELTRGLLRRSSDHFDVLEHDAVQEALADAGIRVAELKTSAIRRVAVKGEPMPAMAVGTLRTRTGRRVIMQCELLGTPELKSLEVVTAEADLNDSELGMLGKSFKVPPPQAPSIDVPEPPDWVEKVLPSTTGGDEPKVPPTSVWDDPTLPFAVRVFVDGQERKGTILAGEKYVPLDRGETYTIRVENRADDVVLMRLLVDGRNTLPEEAAVAKTLDVVEVPLEPAQTVNLKDAKHWLLLPDKTYEIRGFFSKVGKTGKYLEFKVVDAPSDSTGLRDTFEEQAGIITAAFYNAGAPTRGLMTEPGSERDQEITMHKNYEVGSQIVVLNLHYLEPGAVELLKSDNEPRPEPLVE